MMRNFNDARFANVFGRIHMAINPGLRAYHWQADGVDWRREHMSHHGADYSFQCETYVLKSLGVKKTWVFMYVSDTWWDMGGKSVLRSHYWGKLMQGKKTDVIAWMKAQEEKLDKKTR